MSSAIDFYFDFSSPYGYFGSTRIDELAAKYGRTVNWHPVLLGVVFRNTGCAPLTQVPLKGDYSWLDFARTARFHGIDYNRPDPFPIPTQHAARAMLWLQANQGAAVAVAFAKAIYRAYFVDGRNIAEPAQVHHVAQSLGLDAEALEAGATSAAVKEQLKADIESAIGKGVFGSPFLLADGEPFWGFDRFDQLEAHLRGALS